MLSVANALWFILIHLKIYTQRLLIKLWIGFESISYESSDQQVYKVNYEVFCGRVLKTHVQLT